MENLKLRFLKFYCTDSRLSGHYPERLSTRKSLKTCPILSKGEIRTQLKIYDEALQSKMIDWVLSTPVLWCVKGF